MLAPGRAATRLLLIRHGQGRANIEHVIAGLRGCTGLTPTGRVQVEALGAAWVAARFRPDALLTSPVRRARESADILSLCLGSPEVVEDCSLCEMHLGEADGLTWSAYEATYGRPFDLAAEPDRPFAPGAESWGEVLDRVEATLAGIVRRHPGATIAVVTHAGVIVASMLRLFGIPPGARRAYLDPGYTSVTCWQAARDAWELVAFNDTSHLGGLPRRLAWPPLRHTE
jgi:probable phosphoglycerate mutase